MGSQQFRRLIQPIVQYHRRNIFNDTRPRPHRIHPYRRPTPHPSTTSSSSSNSSRHSVAINSEDTSFHRSSPLDSAASITSFHTSEAPNPNTQPGSQLNPIDVDENSCHCDSEGGLCDGCDTRIWSCPHCHQEGHAREDCDALIRSFDKCDTCTFFHQEVCEHYDVTPAWVKRQKTRLNLLD